MTSPAPPRGDRSLPRGGHRGARRGAAAPAADAGRRPAQRSGLGPDLLDRRWPTLMSSNTAWSRRFPGRHLVWRAEVIACLPPVPSRSDQIPDPVRPSPSTSTSSTAASGWPACSTAAPCTCSRRPSPRSCSATMTLCRRHHRPHRLRPDRGAGDRRCLPASAAAQPADDADRSTAPTPAVAGAAAPGPPPPRRRRRCRAVPDSLPA